MDNILVTHKAKWNFQEILPIIILGGLGLFGVFQGIIQSITLAGSIIIAVVGFGLALYVIAISSSRKWKSTLFARLTEDEDLNIEVWMRKPIEDKWAGKLDEGKNKLQLATISSVKVENVRGTPVIALKAKDKRPLYIPVRLAETDELRSFISKAVALKGGKLSFENTAQAKEFAAIIAGGATVKRKVNTKAQVIVPAKSKTISEQIAEQLAEEKAIEDAKPKAIPVEESELEKLEAIELPVEEDLVPQIVKTTNKIDYRAYYTMSATDLITNALIDAEEKELAAMKEFKPLTVSDINNVDSLFAPTSKKTTENPSKPADEKE
jgi:hypothetical protein